MGLYGLLVLCVIYVKQYSCLWQAGGGSEPLAGLSLNATHQPLLLIVVSLDYKLFQSLIFVQEEI